MILAIRGYDNQFRRYCISVKTAIFQDIRCCEQRSTKISYFVGRCLAPLNCLIFPSFNKFPIWDDRCIDFCFPTLRNPEFEINNIYCLLQNYFYQENLNNDALAE